MAEPFRAEGPRLPIEFSRVSADGRVTLVIDPAAPVIQTYCVRMAVSDLDEAIAALGRREKIAPERHRDWVGVQTRSVPERDAGETAPRERSEIARWLERAPFDAVVWTALPSRMPAGELGHPGLDVLVAHLESLEGAALARAEEYVRRAPANVKTPRRARFEEVFGWTPLPSARPGGRIGSLTSADQDER
jgi:hypothetical protein